VKGRVIAQAVSRQLRTTATLVRARISSYGICCGTSSTGAGFLLVLRFPLPILNSTAPHSPLSSGAGTIDQLVAHVPSGLSVTPPHEIKKKLLGKLT
jgi:hypothetical protein